METRDGFIIGVYNYCDRRCERCRLATRCRVFVEEQLEQQGVGLSVMAQGFRSPGGVAAGDGPRPRDRDAAVDEPVPPASPIVPSALTGEAEALHGRARRLGHALLESRVPAGIPQEPRLAEALRSISHFGFFLGPKVFRALIGRAYAAADGGDDDANGSAKAALLALDELESAWLCLAEGGLTGVVEAEPVFRELAEVKGEMERQFPRARAFVRPGLDEPEAVAMLEWQERG